MHWTESLLSLKRAFEVHTRSLNCNWERDSTNLVLCNRKYIWPFLHIADLSQMSLWTLPITAASFSRCWAKLDGLLPSPTSHAWRRKLRRGSDSCNSQKTFVKPPKTLLLMSSLKTAVCPVRGAGNGRWTAAPLWQSRSVLRNPACIAHCVCRAVVASGIGGGVTKLVSNETILKGNKTKCAWGQMINCLHQADH